MITNNMVLQLTWQDPVGDIDLFSICLRMNSTTNTNIFIRHRIWSTSGCHKGGYCTGERSLFSTLRILYFEWMQPSKYLCKICQGQCSENRTFRKTFRPFGTARTKSQEIFGQFEGFTCQVYSKNTKVIVVNDHCYQISKPT